MNMKTVFIIDTIMERRCDGCHECQCKRFVFIACEGFLPTDHAINWQLFRQYSESKLESSSTAPRRKRLAEIFACERMRFLRFVRQQLFEQDAMEAENIVSDVLFGSLR